MGVTLKDVAKKAGVSIGTASMALNNSEKVNIDTYKKVHKVARDLKYIPNARARALVKQSTKIIGLVVPHIINPFFAELAQAVKDTVKKEGYNVILCSTDGKAEEEAHYIDLFKSGMVDGAIFTSQENLSRDNYQLLEELAADYIPVVNINSQDFGSNLIPVIKTDLKKAGYLATKYMIELGHQKIGFGSHSPRRFEGYKEAMKEHGLYNPKYVYYPMSSVDEVVDNILQSRTKPTAFVCYNDKSAIKMIQLLVGQGLRVPEDISVCGTDNIRMSKHYNPPLTTINIPKTEIGDKAARLLLKLIVGERPAESDMEINFPTELVIRKSTASIK
ncbi:LacI family DNA-binding transcriptional regulator [Halocella sp. SP3-1]|uniref:LacI family DNA-binding transcriptional regulator n=1 Tax=Halocella sp. SP3-1 TaxID=2382161 RepID=UPI000F74F786|nr:LacI family DNA-binding transcriptional regulator [Halocella sp. SP3-1]AZO96052.1 LacI family transcriptional regulator [Halocella sp. SP3-1]